MIRSEFIKRFTLGTLALSTMNLKSLAKLSQNFKETPLMPLLFVGHGNPMNAILDNKFSRKWKSLGENLPTPTAILAISAHWLTHNSTAVTAMQQPKTIHDFGGFPKVLFEQQYPALGAPEYVAFTKELVKTTHIHDDHDWGLDHGTWTVLKPMFPSASIPVYQISIDYNASMQFHFDLGRELKALRRKGVLVIGSGNIVHNLTELNPHADAYSWATEFDYNITSFIDQRDYKSVMNFQEMGSVAELAHPSFEHFLPLLYVLGAMEKHENITYFNDSFDLGSISMRSLLIKS